MTEPGSAPVRYAHNGDVRIAFEDLGGAGGDPLLLVMGLGVSRFWWPKGFVGELSRHGFHVVSYDQRDAGESAHFPDTGARSPVAAVLRRRSAAYTAEDMTDDAVAVIDALGWDSAHLFGHSMGGQDTAAAIAGARLVILPGVGHDLPAAVWPRVADEVRALADRADAALVQAD